MILIIALYYVLNFDYLCLSFFRLAGVFFLSCFCVTSLFVLGKTKITRCQRRCGFVFISHKRHRSIVLYTSVYKQSRTLYGGPDTFVLHHDC